MFTRVYDEFNVCVQTTRKRVHNLSDSDAFQDGRPSPHLSYCVETHAPVTCDPDDKVTGSGGNRDRPWWGFFPGDLLTEFGHPILNLEIVSAEVNYLFSVQFPLNDIQGTGPSELPPGPDGFAEGRVLSRGGRDPGDAARWY